MQTSNDICNKHLISDNVQENEVLNVKIEVSNTFTTDNPKNESSIISE